MTPTNVADPFVYNAGQPIWFEWDNSMGLKSGKGSEIRDLIAQAFQSQLLPDQVDVRGLINY